MATKKDLVEAYSFSRRRLVTAFVSGAPGGREVEPARPGRSIVGGLALSVLLVAGAAIAGIFSTNVDPAWSGQPGLIVSEEEAAVYVITESSSDPVLHPVLNITSAKLILGAAEEPQVIPAEYIARERVGSDVGIFGAPSDVPDVSRLIPSGWTACADGQRLRVSVTEEEAVTPAAAEGGLLVRVGPGRSAPLYVVAAGRPDPDGYASAYSYRVPDVPNQVELLDGLGLPLPTQARPVSQAWLDLFPTGGDLSQGAFELDGGAPPVEVDGQRVPVGSTVSPVGGGDYLATQRGLEELTPFAAAVNRAGDLGRPAPVEVSGPVDLSADVPPYDAARWPTDVLDPVFGEACVRLLSEAGERPRLELVQDPSEEAAAAGSDGASVNVDEGRGAYVLSGGWDDSENGQPFVVDAKGYAYPLGGLPDATQLGYGDYPVPVVPDPWIELFNPGVELSTNAALCEPGVGEDPCA